MAAVAALCVQYESDFRPNMTIVVKALQPLVKAADDNDTQAFISPAHVLQRSVLGYLALFA